MTDRERLLSYAAYDALRWFDNRAGGPSVNGQHDDLLIARRLRAALEPLSDDFKDDQVSRYLRKP